MSFSRTHYDVCSYAERLNDNASAFDYALDTVKYENCRQCRFELGLVGGNNVSRADDLVDIESNLMGIDRPASRCAEYSFFPSDRDYVRGIGQHKTTCYPKISTEARHLPACQMFRYHPVQMPPKHVPFRCG